ncbi:MAG TPA: phage holin family protein [Gracilimonas sp.]|uniref:phage holin family protein n=1 Tax=Gracilimonas sp. TaxID=1974203 RepID=UPI002DA357C4|nr:phage holin family protein [Gracilimonas sp.]
MDDLGKRIKNVTHELKDYIETKLELTLLNVGDKVTYWISKSIQNLIGYTILTIGLIFAMTALAIYLGEVLNERWAGYAIVASSFIIFGLIFVIVSPKSISRRIQNQIIAELLDSMDDDGDKLKELPPEKTSKKELK